MNNKTLSIAPMMQWTDRHCRMFHRQLSKHALLYTEMVTTGAIIFGDAARFLSYHGDEHPVALQLGGGDPSELAQATHIASRYGYDEINLNVGCPSDRVQRGKIGACLMAEPELVRDCVLAMQTETDAEVTVKHRLAIDDMDERTVFNFVDIVAHSGCETFIVHARKAFLQGLDPKANRDVPPLRYELVYELKERYPELTVVLNGGVKTREEICTHLRFVDGVMIGREAYHNPWLIASFDEIVGETVSIAQRKAAIVSLMPYIEAELANSTPLKHITRHWLGLFNGQAGARKFRQHLSENAPHRNDTALIDEALALVKAD